MCNSTLNKYIAGIGCFFPRLLLILHTQLLRAINSIYILLFDVTSVAQDLSSHISSTPLLNEL